MSARAFAQQLRTYAKKVEKGAETAVRQYSVELFSALQSNTARLTGFAQSGWNYSLGTPDFSTEGVRDPAAVYMRKAPVQAAKFRLGDTIHLANGVEYIGVLDEGSSPKAPLGIQTPALASVEGRLDQLLQQSVPQ